MSDDGEGEQEKLPTDEGLPTSADGDEEREEEQSGDYVVEVPGGIIYYSRGIAEVRTGSCTAMNSARRS